MIAALFVETGGVYANLDGVDAWDIRRDARAYAGPWPVVAHPPCARWVNFAHLNFKRWGGEHNRPGNDGGCFAAALASVRTFGGVLEHPAESHAWPTFGLATPVFGCWTLCTDGIAVTEVWQSAYGHLARKRTWLVARAPRLPLLRWVRKLGTHQCGKFDRNKPTIEGPRASRTPIEFRDMLLSIARSASKVAA